MIDPVDTASSWWRRRRLVQSMGSYLSRMTARDLTRMGVEIHLQPW